MSPRKAARGAVLTFAAVALSGALAAGCAADTYPPAVGGYSTVYASSVPPNIYAYPHTPYYGNSAYLVGNRWYYPHGDRWVIIQEEPPPLYRYRTTYLGQPYRARPAPPPFPYPTEYETPRQTAPPVEYGYPPPAVRVR